VVFVQRVLPQIYCTKLLRIEAAIDENNDRKGNCPYTYILQSFRRGGSRTAPALNLLYVEYCRDFYILVLFREENYLIAHAVGD